MPRNAKIAVWTSTVALALLAACGGKESAEPEGAAKSPNGETQQQPQPQTQTDIRSSFAELNVFSRSGDSVESFDERFGNAIRSKFPNYKINYIRAQKGSMLEDLLAAGTTIDLYFDSIGNFADGLLKNKMEYDMSELIKQKQIDLNRFEPSLIDAMRYISNGKIYGLPVYTNNLVLFYNKSVFDNFGIEHPKDGMTWDEAIELAKKLNRKDGDKQYLGLAVSPTHMLRMNQLSLPYVDPQTDKATINTDPRWKQLYNATMIDPAQDAGYREAVGQLKNALPSRLAFHNDQYLGMYVFLSQLPFTVTPEMSKVNWDMVSLPTFKELPGIGSQSYPTYFSVTNMSKAKEAAMEVIQFLISDEFQLALSSKGTMPVLNNDAVKKAFGRDTVFKGKNFAAVFYNKFAPIAPKSVYDGAVEPAYIKDIGLMIRGEVDINTAFRTAEEAANKAIEEMKSR